MKFIQKYVLVSHCYTMLFVLLFAAPLVAQDTRFTVVIDAGHGGHDPGAMGAISREKDINLVIALDLGAIIEQKYKDVKVVYTRKTDRYLTLQERADVVNNNHADLFICVHTNSAKSSAAFGAETFTLGVNNSRTKGNLEVAMRENSVITLEENYITKYQGFDPNSVDSYIMFEFMQNKYIDRSVEFASTIQKQFRNYCKRFDRGVQQESFWVLYRSACPSVLIEVGFISNSAEERYLNSESGQNEIASGIFNAFVDYKREHDKKSGKHISSVSKIDRPAKSEDISKSNKKHEVSDTTQPEPTTKLIAQAQSQIDTTPQIQPKSQAQVVVPVESKKEKEVDLGGVFKASSDIKKENISTTPVFKVQLIASAKPLRPNSPEFKGMKNIDSFTEGGMIKYTVGAETDYSKIEKIRLDIHKKFPDAFIVAFVGNKKISAKEGLRLMK